MAGFWQRLFRREAGAASEKTTKADNSFFLDPDAAKTLGNIDYMRTPRVVKHTFPTVNGQKPDDLVMEVSALEQKQVSTSPPPAVRSESSPAELPPAAAASEQRRAARELDPFRAMARELRK